MKNSPSLVALTLLALTIYQHLPVCRSLPLNQLPESSYLSRPTRLARAVRSSLPTPIILEPRRELSQSGSTDLALEATGVSSGQTAIEDSVQDEDSLEVAVANASLADLHDLNRTIATVKISHPNKLLLVLQQLARDIAWSMFETSYRHRSRGQLSEEPMSKHRMMIERDGPPFPTFS